MKHYKKDKPQKTKINCPKCGKELTEHEIFFGHCKCQAPVKLVTDEATSVRDRSTRKP